MKEREPTKGSLMILKARAEKGASSLAGRLISCECIPGGGRQGGEHAGCVCLGLMPGGHPPCRPCVQRWEHVKPSVITRDHCCIFFGSLDCTPQTTYPPLD